GGHPDRRRVGVLLEPVFRRFHLFALSPIGLDLLLWREAVLPESGVCEYAAQRVIVLLRDWIVLVIVAARAGDGQAEEAFCQRIDLVVALIRAGFDEHNVVA